MMPSAPRWFLRRLRARVPFSVTLVILVVGLTALAGAALGTVAWREKRALSRQLLEDTMGRTARLASAQAERFLREAETAARLGPELVAQGLLDVGRDEALERFTVATLRTHPTLAWVSYGDRDDRFVGAWRDANGYVYVNRSGPRAGHIHLQEDRLLPGGGREPVRRSDDHGYRPRERPYFRLAERQRGVAWTEPYEFYAGGGTGISGVAPIFDMEGAVRGVFTVDLSLDGLGEFLDGLKVSPRGRVFVATRSGALVIGPQRGAEPGALELATALVARMASQTSDESEASFAFDHAGERLLGRSVPLSIGEAPWRILVSVPERDYTEPVDAVARRTAGVSLVALGLVAVGGALATRRLLRPLGRLAGRARRFGAGAEGAQAAPRDEIETLTQTLRGAVRATRERELARDLLGRYVHPELAERWLRDRGSSRLAAEPREVAILMSDLRGFSALSEQLGPEAMFGLLDRYLGRMTDVIFAHGGTVNEFIGDGILVLFGAPTRHADDVERSVRCAWAMQQALAALNREGREQGLPELGMGIGLHAGTVVAGSIGGRDRVAYTVVGPVVNRTSRIVDLAQAGEVLVSDTVLAEVRDLVRVGPARRVRVKGVSEPLTVHALAGVKDPGAPTPLTVVRSA